MSQNSDRFKDISWSELERYVAKDLSPAELRDFEVLLADRPAARQLIEAYRVTAATLAPRPTATDVDAALERLYDRLEERAVIQADTVSKELPLFRRDGKLSDWASDFGAYRLRRWTITGVVGIAAIAGAILMYRVPRASTALASAHTYATTREERATVTLRDGTIVTLAPQTTLIVSDDFGTKGRTVSLIGEAYFEVTKTMGSPFIVRTGDVTTHVLGTAFDVIRYRGDRIAKIAVMSGKVSVAQVSQEEGRPARSLLVVTEGMVAQVADSTITATMVGDLSQYSAWTRGALSFHNTPVLEVLSTVGHWYGYQFQVADSTLATRSLTAVFEGESSADVLRSLETLLHVRMDFDGQTVTLRPQMSNARVPRPTRRAFLDSLATLNREVGR